MHSGEVSGNELTHLGEGANANCMNWEDSGCLLKGVMTGQQQRCRTCTPARASHLASNHALRRAITTSALPPPLLP